MKTKLIWKHKWLDDKSGSWYSAKVPALGWEYIVEDNMGGNWVVGLYLSKVDSEVAQITKNDFKSKTAAMNACERHLHTTAEKFNKWFNTK
jgi:hypothetical protein